jgi:hypothetical protein
MLTQRHSYRKGTHAMRALLTFVTIMVISTSATTARTWFINPEGTGDAPTIQAGVDSTSAGDTVLVAAGTYIGVGNKNIDLTGKAVLVISESGPEVTIVDCEGSGRGFYWGRLPDSSAVIVSRLEGFTVTAGNVIGEDDDMGGGIYHYCYHHSLATINNCIITGCSARMGGGITCRGTSPTISNCLISDNTGRGAAGIYIYDSSPLITGCTIIRNSATTGSGGGVLCYGSSGILLNCIIAKNISATGGGGIWCGPDAMRIIGCTVAHNSAGGNGGGIYFDAWSPIVENTIIAFSTQGEGIYCTYYSYPALSCCDIYGNAGGDWVGYIAGQYGVNGNFSACPSFCNTEIGDFHLCDESPCAPGNHPDGYECGLIGAWDVGCSCGPSTTRITTWGGIKALYR